MAFKIFCLTIPNDGETESEMNRFLSVNRIVSVRTQWVMREDIPYQVFTVEYVQGKEQQTELTTPPSSQANARIDYKDLLSDAEFSRYCKLRDERKKIAKEESVKLFVVFSNAQLAAIAQLEKPTLEDIKKIEGVGESRIAKYGERILAALAEDIPLETIEDDELLSTEKS